MRAVEFIKKFGWLVTKSLVVEYPYTLHFLDVSLDDLKRLVKSHELVASWGGLSDAKVAVKVSRHKKYLKRAIADVESCQ